MVGVHACHAGDSGSGLGPGALFFRFHLGSLFRVLIATQSRGENG